MNCCTIYYHACDYIAPCRVQLHLILQNIHFCSNTSRGGFLCRQLEAAAPQYTIHNTHRTTPDKAGRTVSWSLYQLAVLSSAAQQTLVTFGISFFKSRSRLERFGPIIDMHIQTPAGILVSNVLYLHDLKYRYKMNDAFLWPSATKY